MHTTKITKQQNANLQFQGTNRKSLDCAFLIGGYVRQVLKKYNVSIDTFCGIIEIYYGCTIRIDAIYLKNKCEIDANKINESIVCNFGVTNDSNNSHDSRMSTIIFKPFISQLLSLKGKSNGKVTKSNSLITMHIRLLSLDCNNVCYQKQGYFLQCGVFSIPKNSENGNNNYNDYCELSLVEIEKVLKRTYNKDKLVLLSTITAINNKHSNKLKIGSYYAQYVYLSPLLEYNCIIGKDGHSVIYEDFQDKFDEKFCLCQNDCVSVSIDSNNYLSFLHSNLKLNATTMKTQCIDKNNEYNENDDHTYTGNSTNGKKNDRLENDLGEYLKMLKNPNTQTTRLQENINQDDDHNKAIHDQDQDQLRIELDFDKYDYLFAISSACCNCDRKKYNGFQFQVFWD